MNNSARLYAARVISSFGSWLTIIAISLSLAKQYGSEHVAINLMIQTLPTILISGIVVKVSRKFSYLRIYVACQLIASLNVAALIIDGGLFQIYVFSILNSIIFVFAQPTYSVLIAAAVKKDELQNVYTRIDGITTSIMALAPPVGATIAMNWGYSILYAVDALSFLVGLYFVASLQLDAGILFNKQRQNNTEEPLYKTIPFLKARAEILILYFWIGSIISAVEYRVFENYSFNKVDIGILLGFFGAGSFASIFIDKTKIKSINFAYIMIASEFLFLLTPYFIAALFVQFLMGLSSTLFVGNWKAKIQELLIDKDSSIVMWSHINKQMAKTKLIGYSLIALLLYIDSSFISLTMVYVFSGLIFLTSIRLHYRDSSDLLNTI